MAEPKVRFRRDDGGNFPAWEQGRFGDLIEVYDEKVTSDCTLPVLTSSKTDGIQYQSDHFGREQLHDITGYNVIPRGYCTYRNRSDGTDFTFNINNLCDRGIVSKFYPVFHTTARCNLFFLMTLMNNEPKTVRKIATTAKGTGQKVLSFLDLQKIEINIPSLEEQQKIADFLSSVDEVITASEEEVANLETQKKAVMKKIFSQEVRFKRDDGSDFPDWEKMLFWDAVSLNSALVDPKEEPFCNMLHVGAANIEKNTGVLLRCSTAAEEGITSGKYLFDEKCVVYSKIRPELSKATIPGFVGLCSADAYPLKPREGILPTIILLQLLSDKFVKFATSTSARTKMPKINQEELGEYMFVIPCLDEQRLIADFLSDFDEAIAAAKKELELWKELKKGLLQQMFI